jgi:hypothetical protein
MSLVKSIKTKIRRFRIERQLPNWDVYITMKDSEKVPYSKLTDDAKNLVCNLCSGRNSDSEDARKELEARYPSMVKFTRTAYGGPYNIRSCASPFLVSADYPIRDVEDFPSSLRIVDSEHPEITLDEII